MFFMIYYVINILLHVSDTITFPVNLQAHGTIPNLIRKG